MSLALLARAALAMRAPAACSPGDSDVEFRNPGGLTDAVPAREEFVRLLDSGPLVETLCVNRHRVAGKGATLSVPRALRIFDWVLLARQPEKHTDNPRSVFCTSLGVAKCNALVSKLPKLGADETRVLAIGDSDINLSTQRKGVQDLIDSGKFSRVLFEGKDIKMDGVHYLPTCLSDYYLSRGDNRSVATTIRSASLLHKDKSVLAAWGLLWHKLDKTVSSRMQADEFTKSSCLVPRRSIPEDQYWQELARHRFLLAPSGAAVGTSKIMEALLVLTIPIVQRVPDGGAWEELRDTYGWPLVIVDKWDEVTADNLRKWWQELAPQLHTARPRLSADYWFSKVMSG